MTVSTTTTGPAWHTELAPPPVDRHHGGTPRLRSIDVLRGAIMVLMAIDHVRVYAGLPAGGPTPGIFFTRWVTHFCAPGFVFLAGTAAFLYGRKVGRSAALARFLVTRGLLLVALELTVIRIGWTFGVDYSQFVLAGVIWMLGWCMVLLAAFAWMPPRVVGAIGIGIVFLQWAFALPGAVVGPAWEFVYPSGGQAPPPFSVLYVLVPWIGVMMAGYGFGTLLQRSDAERRRLLHWIGLLATAAFLATAGFLALQPADDARGFVYRLLDQRKYPASQLYLLMTLGPMIALLPALERARGRAADALEIVGRVPLFYYLLHIPLIHATALLVNVVRTGAPHQEWYALAPWTQVPEPHWWPLRLLYVVFVVDVVLLYFACRWYAGVKARRGGWLRYI